MKEKRWVYFASVTVTVLGAALAAYLLFRTLLPLFLPFLLALCLGFLLHPLVRRLAARTRISERVLFVALMFLSLLFFSGALVLLCRRALLEAQHFLENLGKESTGALAGAERISGFFRRLFERLTAKEGALGWISYFVENPVATIEGQVRAWIERLAEQLPVLAMGVLRALPKIFFFLLVTLIACFYVALDFKKITALLLKLLPGSLREQIPAFCQKTRKTLFFCLRAYFLLFLITFAELAVGLSLLRVPYVLLPSLFIALLDILPVFGVGTALVPWSVFALVGGNTPLAVGLLVLYGLMTILRQVLEPHVVGKSLGLHPLLMLFSFYLALGLFGALGILLAPLLAVLLKFGGLLLLQRGKKADTP